ncbi:MAG: hypothetical protein CMO80_22085 [Verrucomicrobiales bacterium]|nr:hypothetical protein [Verrucomicrobiales bacterium]|tara:strand:+ start:18709 stop:19215 length:507 start_codon:yes stop_codon:yes gene_type:complete
MSNENTIVLDAQVQLMDSFEFNRWGRRKVIHDELNGMFSPSGKPCDPRDVYRETTSINYTDFSYRNMYTNSAYVQKHFPALAKYASYLDYNSLDQNGVIVSFDFKLSPEVADVLKMQACILDHQHEQALKRQAAQTEYWEKTALGRKMRIDELRGHWLMGRLIKWLCI